MDHADHNMHNGHMHHTMGDPVTSASINSHPGDHMHETHSGGHGDHDGDGSMGHMMSMAFHFGINETVLFNSWTFNSVGGLIGSMIGIFFLAALYEGLKYYREYLFWKTYNALQYRAVAFPAEKGVVNEDNQVVQPTMLSGMHCFQTVLHILQITLSYFLMLIFMTYNVWLCIAVVFGAALGYFLFGWKKSVIVDVTEHCH